MKCQGITFISGECESAGLYLHPPQAVCANSRLCSLGPLERFQTKVPIASQSWWECLGPSLESCFRFFLPRAAARCLSSSHCDVPARTVLSDGAWLSLITTDSSPTGAWTCQTSPTPKPVRAVILDRRGGKRDPGN